jgi:hypothetical protein
MKSRFDDLASICKATHRDVKAALIFDDSRRDFGEMVDDLLGRWLEGLPADIRQALPSRRKR